MTRFKLTTVLGSLLMCLLYVAPASAQATRTWVSGVGDDANPCSRTAPCKTFAGAISKTAARGEISVLDPGGFGAVTITKSISIVNDDSGEAGILASGTNGVIINAAATDIVILRGLVIDGGTAAVPGLNGIRFLAGAALHVQKSIIKNFTSAAAGNGFGILFAPSTAGAELYVSDTTITDNGSGGNGAGVQIAPTGAGTAKAVLNRVQIENSSVGIRADVTGTTGTGNLVSIIDSVVSGNTNAGIVAVAQGAPTAAIMFERTSSVFNASGVVGNGGNAIIRFANSTVTGNTTGLAAVGGAQLLSYKTNNLVGNTTEGAPTGFLIPN
jgi:hypothetical protein